MIGHATMFFCENMPMGKWYRFLQTRCPSCRSTTSAKALSKHWRRCISWNVSQYSQFKLKWNCTWCGKCKIWHLIRRCLAFNMHHSATNNFNHLTQVIASLFQQKINLFRQHWCLHLLMVFQNPSMSLRFCTTVYNCCMRVCFWTHFTSVLAYLLTYKLMLQVSTERLINSKVCMALTNCNN